MWIEKAWAPKLQREYDRSIMERFVEIQGATVGQLRKVNTVRLYLRVVTITDLTHPSGEYIPDGMLMGDWQAGSDLEWPHQPCPPRSHWALFRIFYALLFVREPHHTREQIIAWNSTPHWANGTRWFTTRGFRASRWRRNYFTEKKTLERSKCS